MKKNCKLSLIPNPAGKLVLRGTAEYYKKISDFIGREIKEGEWMVDILIVDEDGRDISNHPFIKEYTDLDGEKYRRSILPKYVPASIFEGRKEGDIMTFNYEGHEFECTLQMQGSRYNHIYNEPFEKVLSNILEVGIGLDNGSWEFSPEHWCFQKKAV